MSSIFDRINQLNGTPYAPLDLNEGYDTGAIAQKNRVSPLQARQALVQEAAIRNAERIQDNSRLEIESARRILAGAGLPAYMGMQSPMERYQALLDNRSTYADPEMQRDLEIGSLEYLANKYGVDVANAEAGRRNQLESLSRSQTSTTDVERSNWTAVPQGVIQGLSDIYETGSLLADMALHSGKDELDEMKKTQDNAAQRRATIASWFGEGASLENEVNNNSALAGDVVGDAVRRSNSGLTNDGRLALAAGDQAATSAYARNSGYNTSTLIQGVTSQAGQILLSAITSGGTSYLGKQALAQLPKQALSFIDKAVAKNPNLVRALAVGNNVIAAGATGGIQDGMSAYAEAAGNVLDYGMQMNAEQKAEFMRTNPIAQQVLAQNPNASFEEVIGKVAEQAANQAGLQSGLTTGFLSGISGIGTLPSVNPKGLGKGVVGGLTARQRMLAGLASPLAEAGSEFVEEYVNNVAPVSATNQAVGKEITSDRYAGINAARAALAAGAASSPALASSAVHGVRKLAGEKLAPAWNAFAQSRAEKAEAAKAGAEAKSAKAKTESTEQAFSNLFGSKEPSGETFTSTGAYGSTEGDAGYMSGKPIQETEFGKAYNKHRDMFKQYSDKEAANYTDTLHNIFKRASELAAKTDRTKGEAAELNQLETSRKELYEAMIQDIRKPESIAQTLADRDRLEQALEAVEKHSEEVADKGKDYLNALPENERKAFIEGVMVQQEVENAFNNSTNFAKVIDSELFGLLSGKLDDPTVTENREQRIPTQAPKAPVSWGQVLFSKSNDQKQNTSQDAYTQLSDWLGKVGTLDVSKLSRENNTAKSALQRLQSKMGEHIAAAEAVGYNIDKNSYLGKVWEHFGGIDFSKWNNDAAYSFLDKFVGKRGVLGYLQSSLTGTQIQKPLMQFMKSQADKLTGLNAALLEAHKNKDANGNLVQVQEVAMPSGGKLKNLSGKPVSFKHIKQIERYSNIVSNEAAAFQSLLADLLKGNLKPVSKDFGSSNTKAPTQQQNPVKTQPEPNKATSEPKASEPTAETKEAPVAAKEPVQKKEAKPVQQEEVKPNVLEEPKAKEQVTSVVEDKETDETNSEPKENTGQEVKEAESVVKESLLKSKEEKLAKIQDGIHLVLKEAENRNAENGSVSKDDFFVRGISDKGFVYEEFVQESKQDGENETIPEVSVEQILSPITSESEAASLVKMWFPKAEDTYLDKQNVGKTKKVLNTLRGIAERLNDLFTNAEEDVFAHLNESNLSKMSDVAFTKYAARFNAFLAFKEYDEKGNPKLSGKVLRALTLSMYHAIADGVTFKTNKPSQILESLKQTLGNGDLEIKDVTPFQRQSYYQTKDDKLAVRDNRKKATTPLNQGDDLFTHLGSPAFSVNTDLGKVFLKEMGIKFKYDAPAEIKQYEQVVGNELTSAMIAGGLLSHLTVKGDKPVTLHYYSPAYKNGGIWSYGKDAEFIQEVGLSGIRDKADAARLAQIDAVNDSWLSLAHDIIESSRSNLYRDATAKSSNNGGYRIVTDKDDAGFEVTPNDISDLVFDNLPERQAEALKYHNKIKYKIAPKFLNLLKTDPIQLMQLFGAVNVEEDAYKFKSREEIADIKANNYRIKESVFKLLELVQEAEEQGISPEDIRVQIKHGTTENNRILQQGKFRPQADKVMRELLIPDIAVDIDKVDTLPDDIDIPYGSVNMSEFKEMLRPLNTVGKYTLPEKKGDYRSVSQLISSYKRSRSPENKQMLKGLILGMAQALGVKIEKLPENVILDKLVATIEPYQELAKALHDISEGESVDLPKDLLNQIHTKFGTDAPHALSALMAWGNWSYGTGKYSYDLFVEHDGIANGFANLIQQFSPTHVFGEDFQPIGILRMKELQKILKEKKLDLSKLTEEQVKDALKDVSGTGWFFGQEGHEDLYEKTALAAGAGLINEIQDVDNHKFMYVLRSSIAAIQVMGGFGSGVSLAAFRDFHYNANDLQRQKEVLTQFLKDNHLSRNMAKKTITPKVYGGGHLGVESQLQIDFKKSFKEKLYSLYEKANSRQDKTLHLSQDMAYHLYETFRVAGFSKDNNPLLDKKKRTLTVKEIHAMISQPVNANLEFLGSFLNTISEATFPEVFNTARTVYELTDVLDTVFLESFSKEYEKAVKSRNERMGYSNTDPRRLLSLSTKETKRIAAKVGLPTAFMTAMGNDGTTYADYFNNAHAIIKDGFVEGGINGYVSSTIAPVFSLLDSNGNLVAPSTSAMASATILPRLKHYQLSGATAFTNTVVSTEAVSQATVAKVLGEVGLAQLNVWDGYNADGKLAAAVSHLANQSFDLVHSNYNLAEQMFRKVINAISTNPDEVIKHLKDGFEEKLQEIASIAANKYAYNQVWQKYSPRLVQQFAGAGSGYLANVNALLKPETKEEIEKRTKEVETAFLSKYDELMDLAKKSYLDLAPITSNEAVSEVFLNQGNVNEIAEAFTSYTNGKSAPYSLVKNILREMPSLGHIKVYGKMSDFLTAMQEAHVSEEKLYEIEAENPKGAYVAGVGIYVNMMNNPSHITQAKTFAHELVHAATQQMITDYFYAPKALTKRARLLMGTLYSDMGKYVQSMRAMPIKAVNFPAQDVANFLRDRIKENSSKEEKAEALAEYMAYIATEPSVQIQASSVGKTHRNLLEKVQEVLKNSWNAVKEFFGFKTGEDSILGTSLGALTQLIKFNTKLWQEENGNYQSTVKPDGKPRYSRDFNRATDNDLFLQRFYDDLVQSGVYASLPNQLKREQFAEVKRLADESTLANDLVQAGISLTDTERTYLPLVQAVFGLVLNGNHERLRNDVEQFMNKLREGMDIKDKAYDVLFPSSKFDLAKSFAAVVASADLQSQQSGNLKKDLGKLFKAHSFFTTLRDDLDEFGNGESLKELAIAIANADLSNAVTTEKLQEALNEDIKKGAARHELLKRFKEVSSKLPDKAETVLNAAASDLLLHYDIASEQLDSSIGKVLQDIADERRYRKGERDWLVAVLRWVLQARDVTSPIYAMRSRFAANVQATKENLSHVIPATVMEAFDSNYDEELDGLLGRTINTTKLHTLRNVSNLDKVLEDDATFSQALNQQEAAIEKALSFLSPSERKASLNYILWQVQGLSDMDFLGSASSVSGESGHIMQNTRAITMTLPTISDKQRIQYYDSLWNEVLPEVEKLYSLYGVAKLSLEDRAELASTIREFPNGVKAYLDAQARLYDMFAEIYRNSIEGAEVPVTGSRDDSVDFMLATTEQSELKDLKGKGYQYVGDTPTGHGIYVNTASPLRRYQTGIFGVVDFTPYGEGYNNFGGKTAAFIPQDKKGRATSSQQFAEAIKRASADRNYYSNLSGKSSTMVQLDGLGNVMGYRDVLPENIRTKYQKTIRGVDDIGSAWGDLFERSFVLKQNQENVVKLNEAAKADPKLNLNYIHVIPEEVDNKRNFRVEKASAKGMAEVLNFINMLPEHTKAAIEKEGGLYLHKGELDNIIGYETLSLSDVVLNSVPDRAKETVKEFLQSSSVGGFTPLQWLNKGERFWSELVSASKDVMLVRSIRVAAGNLISNALHLWNKGLSPKEVGKHVEEGWILAKNYIRSYSRLQELNYLREAPDITDDVKKQYDSEIAFINASLDSNPTAILFQEGMMSSISAIAEIAYDVGNDKFGVRQAAKAKINAGLKRILGEEKVRRLKQSKLSKGFDEVLLNEGSSVREWVEQAIDLGDFVSKYALYKHLTEEKGWSSSKALNLVREEFVNYSMNRGQVFDFANKMGLAWFASYALGIQKIIMRLLRNNPSRTLALLAGNKTLGGMLDIVPEQNLFQKNWDYLSSPSNAWEGFSSHYLDEVFKAVL